MAASREPRRIARQGWEIPTHLGELDSDVDELHLLRDQDRGRNAAESKRLEDKQSTESKRLETKHDADIARLEAKFDRMTRAMWAAAVSGATATVALLGNLFKGEF